MMRRIAPVALLACLVLLSLVSRARTAEPPLVPPDVARQAAATGSVRVIVRVNAPFVPEHSLGSAAAALGQRQLISSVQSAVTSGLRGVDHRVTHQFDATLPLLALEASPDALRILESMRGLVLDVQEDRVRYPMLADSVPLINGDGAWNAGVDGTGTIVAILDTGVDSSHPFLNANGVGKVIREVCFSTTSSVSTSVCPSGSTAPGSAAPCNLPGCDHGTHVAGIAAGGTTGVLGSGVAPGAKIIAIQVFSSFGGSPASYDSDQIAGLNYLFNHRNDFPGLTLASVNMSLGGDSSSTFCDTEPQKAAIDQLRAVGVATAIASGNDGFTSAISAPGCISSAISVGSTTKTDGVSFFSNVAPFLSLFAPGGSATGGAADILSSVPGGGFGRKAGTSMATPHVTGAFAVLRQAAPTATVDQLLAALQDTGKPIADVLSTRPRIDVFAALGQVSSPDLVVQTLAAPPTALPGANVSVTTSVKNVGLGSAGATTLRLYLSGDNVTTTSDTLLKEIPIPALVAGLSSSQSVAVTIPPGTAPGSYFLGAFVNAAGDVTEANPNNNTKAVALKVIQPDLLVTALSSATTAQTTRSLTISSKVWNRGTAPAGPSRLSFYMAQADDTPGAGQRVVFKDLASLAANANVSVTATFTIPANFSAGTYFLSARVDSEGAVTESDENNNGVLASNLVTVTLYRPEVTITALRGPLFGKIGKTISVTSAVRNSGPAPAGTFKIHFFLSSGSSDPGAGTEIGTRSVSSLAVGANVSAATTLTIPDNAGLTEGNYYLSAVADPPPQGELDPTNNGLTAVSQIALTLLRPDLAVTAATATPALASPGFTVKVSNTIKNAGDVATAAPVLVNFYLSPTPTLAGGEPIIGNRSIASPLLVGGTSSAMTPVTIPRTTATGPYFIVVVANDDHEVVEYPGPNNAKATGMVNVQLPNLQVVSVAPAPVAIRGKGVAGAPMAAVVVKNVGFGPALPFDVRVFANRDDGTPGAQIPGAGDLMFNKSVVTSIAPNGSVSLTGPILVEEIVDGNVRLAGNYFVSAIADPALNNVDSDVTNNRLTETVKKVAILPDMKKLKNTAVDITLDPSACGVSILQLRGPFSITNQTLANPSTFTGKVTLDDQLGSGFHQVYTVSGTVQALDLGTGIAGKVVSSFTYTATINNEFASNGRGNINGAAPGLNFNGGSIAGQDSSGTCTFSGSIDVTR